MIKLDNKYYPTLPKPHEDLIDYIHEFFPELMKFVKFSVIFGVKADEFVKLAKIVRYPYVHQYNLTTPLSNKDVRAIKAWMFINKHMYEYWLL